ncbi:hypothetical protein [Comamonas sp. B-9]|uniref:hypothetical protein n=1 Tax=Comamonas sp. B-9 TaxID=1055192 RepID=UPI0011DD0459|nr:hypothetical protein [Comamonas sp. B-9]
MAALLAPLFSALFFIALIALPNANQSGLDILAFISVLLYIGFLSLGYLASLVCRRKRSLPS